jgi:hypothetical protein
MLHFMREKQSSGKFSKKIDPMTLTCVKSLEKSFETLVFSCPREGVGKLL